jgi:hypothetical protein
MTGDIAEGRLGPIDPGVEAVPFTEAEQVNARDLEADLAAFDRAAVGFERAADHRDDRAGGRIGLLFRSRSDGRSVGYGYVQPSGRIGPVYADDPAQLAPMVGVLMEQVRPLGAWQVVVPGPTPALPLLLRAGFRTDPDAAIHCATAPLIAAERYLPRNFALL